MNYKEVMSELEALGTAQNVKVYTRHGVDTKMFGVSFANLGKLQKKIRCDHGLAQRLWKSGNHDARILGMMVADAESVDGATLESWAGDLSNYVITDALSRFVARTPHAAAKAKKWSRSTDEWRSSAGWNVVGSLADGPPGIMRATDDELDAFLDRIEKGIHKALNRTRYAMNNALICIGLRGGALEKRALAIAARIGKVEVDHGETGCKTPDAASYIAKTKAYRKKKAAKKTSKKAAKKATKKKSTKKKATTKTATAKKTAKKKATQKKSAAKKVTKKKAAARKKTARSSKRSTRKKVATRKR